MNFDSRKCATCQAHRKIAIRRRNTRIATAMIFFGAGILALVVIIKTIATLVPSKAEPCTDGSCVEYPVHNVSFDEHPLLKYARGLPSEDEIEMLMNGSSDR